MYDLRFQDFDEIDFYLLSKWSKNHSGLSSMRILNHTSDHSFLVPPARELIQL